jgi:hypothetical protein
VARRRRPSRWASEAALQALIRYGPEESGLRALKQEARGEYRSTVRGARGAARGIVGEVKAVTPQTRAAYDAAGLAAARTAHSVVDPALKGLPQSSLSAAVKIEQGDYQRNLQESKAAELADLGSRRVSAREGAAFAVTNAASERNAALAKIGARFQDLRREKGAFAASTMATLEDDARQRKQQLDIALAGLAQSDLNSRRTARNARRTARQSERNSIRSSGIDPNTGKIIPNGPLDPKAKAKAKGGPTGEQYLNWQTSIEDIASAAKRLRNAKDEHGRPLNLSRAQIVDKLSQGRPAQKVLVDRHGRPLPQGLTPAEKKAAGATVQSLPAIKQYPADLRMSAALDIALFGHLTPATQRRLHRAGFNLKRLGLRTYGQYRSSLRNNATEQGIRAGRLAGPPA